jgi:hypothetical protein
MLGPLPCPKRALCDPIWERSAISPQQTAVLLALAGVESGARVAKARPTRSVRADQTNRLSDDCLDRSIYPDAGHQRTGRVIDVGLNFDLKAFHGNSIHTDQS